MLRRDRLGLPADDEQQRPPGEPARQEEQQPQRRLVGPVRVVDEHRARRRTAEPVEQERADRLVEPHLGRGAVDARAAGGGPSSGSRRATSSTHHGAPSGGPAAASASRSSPLTTP